MRSFHALALFVCLAAYSAAPTIAGELPPFLDGPSLRSGLPAVNATGDRAAVAFLNESESRQLRSTVQLHSADGGDPVSVELQGVIRALLFVEPGPALFVLQHRPAKKQEGDTFLVAIDADSLQVRRHTRLPPSSRGLGYWPRENALLVAARDEIRTVLLPLMRSGPLYRIPGANLSVISVGGSRILVGQESALLEIDLEDLPERERFPSRQNVEVDRPVALLAASADGERLLAGSLDRTLVARLSVAPLQVEEWRPGVLPARLVTVPLPGVELTPTVVATPPEKPPTTTAEPVADDLSSGDADARGPSARPDAHGAFEAAPLPDDPGRPAHHDAFDPASPPPPPPAPAPRPGIQAQGSLSGPAAELAVAVVLLGPDNILREAARVAPSAGGWEVGGLAPGRYRVQLDGGGSRVLVTEPPYHLLDVGNEAPIATADFKVVGVR